VAAAIAGLVKQQDVARYVHLLPRAVHFQGIDALDHFLAMHVGLGHRSPIGRRVIVGIIERRISG
jgi:hypothetical protein